MFSREVYEFFKTTIETGEQQLLSLFVGMSDTRFRVNLHSVVARMSKTPCSKQARYRKFK